jgi:hypothetical protein
MKMDFSDLQASNARSSIRAKCESDSNDMTESAMHAAKHSSDRTSTEAGMQIDLSAEQPLNAFASIRTNRDPDSKITSTSDRHPSLV